MGTGGNGFAARVRRPVARLGSAWRAWSGGRGIFIRMVLLFVVLHYLWDYVGEEVLGLPEKWVDPVGVFASAALVYRIFLRDIEAVFYPEGAVGREGKGRKNADGANDAEIGAAERDGDVSRVARRPGGFTAPSPAADPSRCRFSSVLLVDADPQYLRAATATLRAAGIGPVHAVGNGEEAHSLLSVTNAAVLLLGVEGTEAIGMDLLRTIREEHPQLPIIVTTRSLEIDAAVACVKAGAFDYLVKPVEKNRFLSSVRRALEIRELRGEVSALMEHFLSAPAEEELSFHGIRTRNRRLKAACRYVEAVAASDRPVLITGETGVGKEIVAGAIHRLSGRAGEYVVVNVAGLDDAMFSDTLFGHRKGAYTGAVQGREGLVARASGGTLFLDEIGDLDKGSQVKLLRLLEEREYYPLGADAPVATDARVVCSTHHSLEVLQSTGEFRRDLFYRLQAHHVHIPSLRERMEDLPLLVDQWLEEAARTLGKRKPTPHTGLFALLSAHRFPGNVRELREMIFDAVTRHRAGILPLDSFRRHMQKVSRPQGHPAEGPKLPTGGAPFLLLDQFPTIREANAYLIEEALRRSKGNRTNAALLLGLTREALSKRLARRLVPAPRGKRTDAA